MDLGVDVAPAEFLRAGMEFGADLIAASDLMTGSFPQLRELVRLFDENVFREKVRPMIIIGGGQVDKMVFDMTGSDYLGSRCIFRCTALPKNHGWTITKPNPLT